MPSIGLTPPAESMPNFLADANITKPTVTQLNKAGFTTIHIDFDLGLGKVADSEVLNLGRQKKLTILTNNNKDFQQMARSDIKSSYGVWCLETSDPLAQLERVIRIAKLTQLKTKSQRRGKLVTYTSGGVHIENCLNREVEFFEWKATRVRPRNRLE